MSPSSSKLPMTDDAARARFTAAAAEVYEPLQRYLHRRCPADDVDDLLNDVLLVMWRRLDDIPHDATLPWAYGIARRCLANHRRSGTRRLELVRRAASHRERGAESSFTAHSEVLLHEALDGLPDFDREVVRLWAWENLEPREIAQVLGVTANAVSVRLTRIRGRLESELARKNSGPAGHQTFESHRERES